MSTDVTQFDDFADQSGKSGAHLGHDGNGHEGREQEGLDHVDLDDLHLEDADLDWGEFEELLADFARLTKSDVPFGRVAQGLVEQLVTAAAAVGAAVWLVDEPGSLRLQRQVNLSVLGDVLNADTSHRGELAAEHRQMLLRAVEHGQADVRPAGDTHFGSEPLAYTLLLAPVVIDHRAIGLVEVIQRPSIGRDALDGNLRFAALLAELAADHLRRREVRELRDASRRTRQFEEFLHSLHGSLDPRATASEMANEGRRLIGCDRVSVALRRGRRYRLAAVSSVDAINRRSVAVKRLEELIARVAATGDEFWYEGASADGRHEMAPQIEKALTKYLDESHASTVGIVPLRAPEDKTTGAPGAVIGVVIAEGFDAREWDSSHGATGAVALHGGLALYNSLRYRSLPTLPLLRSRYGVSGEPSRRLVKIAAVATVIAAVAAAFLIKVDFHVYAQGELHPAARNHVFAPLDGQVSIVSVEHGDAVKAGDTLVEISSPELDLEIQKIQGEHDATLQRSRAIEAALLDYGSSLDPDAAEVNQLAAEQEELTQLFASQKERLAALRAQREKLVVQSPIAGEVLTWETDEQLLNRPVRRGQRLMSVADLDGAWEAELRVDDDQVGPLLEEYAEAETPLTATFELATERGLEHHGKVTRLARRTEIDGDNRPVVRVAVQIDEAALADPRPGATVYAKIHCGRQSLFYVWCHTLIDRVRGWLLF